MKMQFRQILWGILFTILLTASHSAFAFFDPTIGKWINRDPIGERGGINLCGFVNNNPINKIDRDGGTIVTISTAPTTGDWGVDTKLGNLFPETFGRIDADIEANGYSSKYARGVEWGSQEEIAAQREELTRAETLSTADRALFAFSAAETLVHACQAIRNGAADDFVKNASDYYRHTLSGDTAWADLDAVCMAADMTVITGRYESAYVVLDILLQND